MTKNKGQDSSKSLISLNSNFSFGEKEDDNTTEFKELESFTRNLSLNEEKEETEKKSFLEIKNPFGFKYKNFSYFHRNKIEENLIKKFLADLINEEKIRILRNMTGFILYHSINKDNIDIEFLCKEATPVIGELENAKRNCIKNKVWIFF